VREKICGVLEYYGEKLHPHIVGAIIDATSDGCDPVYQVKGDKRDQWRETDHITYLRSEWANDRRILFTAPQPSPEVAQLQARIAELERRQGVLVRAIKLADANSREPSDEPWRVFVKSALSDVKNGSQQ